MGVLQQHAGMYPQLPQAYVMSGGAADLVQAQAQVFVCCLHSLKYFQNSRAVFTSSNHLSCHFYPAKEAMT